jgi:hypothetical protein
MAQWGEVARSNTSEWNKNFEETGYVDEIVEYWGRVRDGEEMGRVCEDIGKRSWT